MTPLRWIEVDLAAVAHNARVVRGLLGPKTGFTAVVKSDAYGHGAVPVAKTVLRAGADSLAVTYLDEALALRRGGVSAPVLVMGPVPPDQAPLAVRHRFAVMLDNLPLLNALRRAGRRARPVPVHVKVGLGLARWGLPPSATAAFLRRVERAPGLRLAGIFAHPGYMIGKNASRVEESLEQFLALTAPYRAGRGGVEVHAADSAVLLDFPEFKLSRARVGNLLYGINPTDKPLSLRTPWRALARIVHIEKLAVGQAVGYGGEFVATYPMTVGTVPAGYSHGLTLEPASRWIQVRAGQGYWGMLRGTRCPFVGRVGMSHCLVDLTAVKAPKVGDVLQLPLRRTASSNWEKVYK